MARQAFLHIGGEKTGTTTLQRFLSRNAALLRREGIYYPRGHSNICYANRGHFPVAACLIDGEVDFVTRERQLPSCSVLRVLKEICRSTDDSVVLSCEHFSSRLSESHQLQALKNALPTDDIKVVFYAREPSELALAAWSTAVRFGARDAFGIEAITPENRYYNHLATLDLWANVFGRENVIVREYDRGHLVRGDIRWDFCRLLGVEPKNPYLGQDENISLGVQRLAVLRLINSALPLFSESPSEWRRAEHIRGFVSRCAPPGPPIRQLMCRHDAELIKSRFSKVHEELNERYFDGCLSTTWFPSSHVETASKAAALEQLGEADVLHALRDTIIRMAETVREHNDFQKHAIRSRKIRKKVGAFLGALRAGLSGMNARN